MKTEITVTIELGVATREAVAQLVTAIETAGAKKTRAKKEAPAAEEVEETSTHDVSEIRKGKKGKKNVEEETVEEENQEETVEEESAEDFEEENEESEEDEVSAVVDAEQLSNLKKALNGYSAKKGKDKAVAILHKFAKKSADVKKSDLAKLMKALKI